MELSSFLSLIGKWEILIVLKYSTTEILIKPYSFYSIVLLAKYFCIISIDSQNNLAETEA